MGYHTNICFPMHISGVPQSSHIAATSLESPVYSAAKKPFTLKNILRCIRPMRANWMTISVYLEVDTGTLKAIKTDNDHVEDRLTKMITVWLDRVSPPPTWSALADALEELDQKTAQKIRLTFK